MSIQRVRDAAATECRIQCSRALISALTFVLSVAGLETASAAAMAGRMASPFAQPDGATLVAAEDAVTFSVANIDAESGVEVPITVKLPTPAELRAAGADTGTFMLIRNIPEGVRVSAGMASGRIWVVPLRDAAALRLASSPNVSGRFELGFHLIGPKNRILAKTTVTINLAPRKDTVATIYSPVARIEPPKSSQPTKPARQTQLAGEEEAILLSRAAELLKQGGIVSARLIFQELAARGSAAGALALARSYDPALAAHSSTVVAAPSMTEALKWYERAAELGNQDAKHRLAEIGPSK